MTRILNRVSVWLPGDNPTQEDLISGIGSVGFQEFNSTSDQVVQASFTGLEADTSYSLEWLIQDNNLDFARSTTPFKTLATMDPVPPLDTTKLSYNGQAVTFDASVGWQNADPAGFGASSLPTGLAIDTAGLVTGTPTANGIYPTQITNTNADGTGTWNIQWTVIDTPVIDPDAGGSSLQLMLQLRG